MNTSCPRMKKQKSKTPTTAKRNRVRTAVLLREDATQQRSRTSPSAGTFSDDDVRVPVAFTPGMVWFPRYTTFDSRGHPRTSLHTHDAIRCVPPKLHHVRRVRTSRPKNRRQHMIEIVVPPRDPFQQRSAAASSAKRGGQKTASAKHRDERPPCEAPSRIRAQASAQAAAHAYKRHQENKSCYNRTATAAQ